MEHEPKDNPSVYVLIISVNVLINLSKKFEFYVSSTINVSFLIT
jgi:hypothetical protein